MVQSNSKSEPPNNRLSHPKLEWREDGQPVSSEFQDPYFSVENGLDETRYVFLKHNGLPERWLGWRGPFSIMETGFGTGLNFLATWQAFEQANNENAWLHFTSIEKYPLSKTQLLKACALWPDLQRFTDRLCEQYPAAISGFHHLSWPEHRVSLTLVFGDLHQMMPQIAGPVHAWYLDGFAPSRNPQMWQEPLYGQLRRITLSHPSLFRSESSRPTLATFTAAGLVRRGLKGAGFNMQKQPGYGRKRDMLSGQFAFSMGPERPPEHHQKPWLLPSVSAQAAAPVTTYSDNKQPRPQTNESNDPVVVIGAGLAGCTTARALAERGKQVLLLDEQGIAAGASGNPVGGLYVKLAASANALHTDFYVAAFQTSLAWMKRIQSLTEEPIWSDTGVLQLAYNPAEQERQRKSLHRLNLPAELVHPVTAEQASHIAGTQLTKGGLLFPQAGWVRPNALCQALVDHPNIQFKRLKVRSLEPAEKSALESEGQNSSASSSSSAFTSTSTWRIRSSTADIVTQHLVIATAWQAQQLLPDVWIPTKKIRGQLTYLKPKQGESSTSDGWPNCNAVLCGQAYLSPSIQGINLLGATYHQNDESTEIRRRDHLENLKHLEDFGTDWPSIQESAVAGGRVSFRCTTPDYLPIVGQLPDAKAFIKRYRPMVKNAKQVPGQPCPTLPGLWLNLGHGSRGLASTPLCADLITSQITGDSLPAPLEQIEALWPGRFLLRDMIRKKLPEDFNEI